MAVTINGSTGLTFNNGSTQDVGGVGSGGQGWQDVTASRAFSTNYTNTTGKPIMVSVNLYNGGGGPSSGFGLRVSGILIGNAYQPGIANGFAQLTAIVPSGQTYSCTGTTLGTWLELR